MKSPRYVSGSTRNGEFVDNQTGFPGAVSGSPAPTFLNGARFLMEPPVPIYGRVACHTASRHGFFPGLVTRRLVTAGSPVILLRATGFSRTHYWAKIFETSAIDCILLCIKNDILHKKDFERNILFFRVKVGKKIVEI